MNNRNTLFKHIMPCIVKKRKGGGQIYFITVQAPKIIALEVEDPN